MTRINTNVSSLNAQKTLARNNQSLQTAMTRLSTGLRINSGKDDPAGMIAAAIQSNDIASTQMAISNTQRGSMLIGTADSALGQITGLLRDIRGLVTEVGNTAVMSADQIAANQLQVDSALQAIDRISQVTQFQGQRLLDGSLDFINTAQVIPQIQSLEVDTANLGATGQMAVSVEVAAHAERAQITTSSGEAMANAKLSFAARAEVVSGVWIQADSNSSAYDGVKFAFATGGTAGSETAAYNSTTKTLTVTGAAASTWTQVIAAINSTTVGVGNLFTASGSGGAVGASPTLDHDTLSQVSINIGARAKGIDFNNVKVTMASSATVTSGEAVANYDENSKQLTITVNNGTTGNGAADRLTDSTLLSAIVAKINAVTLSDGTTLAFNATYPTGSAGTDRVFGMITADTATLANSSVSGYMNSAFTAGARATGALTLAAGASIHTNAAGTFAFAAGAGGTVAVRSLVAGTPDTAVTFTKVAAATSAAYTAGTNTLAVSVDDRTTGTFALAGMAHAATITFTSNAAGIGDLDVTFTRTGGAGPSTASYTAGASPALAIEIADTDVETLTTFLGIIQTELTAHAAPFTMTNTGTGTDPVAGATTPDDFTTARTATVDDVIDAIVGHSGAPGTFTAQLLTGNASTLLDGETLTNFNAKAAALDIKSTTLGSTADNVRVAFHTSADVAVGHETAVYDSLLKTLNVTMNASSTVAQVVAAINNSVDTTGAATGAWKATNLNPTVTDGGVFSADAGFVFTSADTVSVEALNPGANYNDMQIRFQTVASLSGTAKAQAGYDEASNTFTIQVKNSEAAADAVTLQDISTAISAVSGFAGSYTTKNAASYVNQSSGIIFGKSVDTTAIGNTGSTGGNTLVADLSLEIGSNDGQQVFTFKAGTTANQVAAAVNVVSDATGVVADQDNSLVDLRSAVYGSKGFVSVNVISEGAGGLLKQSVSSFRENGVDANAKINGVQATANGNQLSINTSSLAMTLNMQAETNGNFRFNILGGGAQFQLGPDVVSNQQLRVGIQSINTARMGGVSGKMYQLSSGSSAALGTDANLAAKIVDDAITSVTSLRGRLGAIQALSMQTNQNTLEDMVENMKTSLSLIQDTDFAAETANLTRAQILTQSGMAVLSIANQQPQQVLSLLPR